MPKLSEVIKQLQAMDWMQDQEVAWTLWTEQDVESQIDCFDTEDTTSEAWKKIVQDMHDELNGDWYTEKIYELMRDLLSQKYDWKN